MASRQSPSAIRSLPFARRRKSHDGQHADRADNQEIEPITRPPTKDARMRSAVARISVCVMIGKSPRRKGVFRARNRDDDDESAAR